MYVHNYPSGGFHEWKPWEQIQEPDLANIWFEIAIPAPERLNVLTFVCVPIEAPHAGVERKKDETKESPCICLNIYDLIKLNHCQKKYKKTFIRGIKISLHHPKHKPYIKEYIFFIHSKLICGMIIYIIHFLLNENILGYVT